MAAKKFVQTNTLFLAGSGVIVGATSIILTSFTDIYGNALALSDFGDKGYGTLEPDTTNEEAFTFTTVTVNANGTVTLGGVSTALAKSPYTETSGLTRQHSGGTKLVISDNVAFWNTFANVNNQETWADIQTFSVPPISATDPTSSSQVANKHYVDGVAVAGAPNASATVKGIVQEATQAQVLAKTASGGTGAELYINPLTLPSTLVSDYKVDTGAANAYAIAPAPAITAYVTGQVFSFKAVNANTTASTFAVSGLTTKAIVNSKGGALVANDILASMIVTVEYDGTSMVMQNPVANAPTTAPAINFGGTGSDGALTVSSGTTSINLGGAAVVVKNYTSISITGTGVVNFTNPAAGGTLVILKSQGNVTLTSSATPMLDASGIGSAGGATTVCTNASANGAPGTAATSFSFTKAVGGSGTTGSAATYAAGNGAAVPTTVSYASYTSSNQVPYSNVFVGSGGAAGAGVGNSNASGTITGTAGAGGFGGGALVIECGGALNFTTTNGISVAGQNGAAATYTSGTFGNLSGGSGGGGGFFLMLYNALTANSGTVNVSGGIGGVGAGPGASGNNTSATGGAGGNPINAGGNGTTTTSGPLTGATGGSGISLVGQNPR